VNGETDMFQTSGMIHTLGGALIHSLWQGLLIAACLFAVGLFIKRATVRYILACMAMLLMLLGFLVTFAVLRNPTPVQMINAKTESPVQVASSNTSDVTPTTSQETSASTSQDTASQTSTSEARASFNLKNKLHDGLPVLVGVWVFGVFFLTLRLFLQWLYAERLKRRFTKPVSKELQALLLGLMLQLKISKPVQLLESVRVDVPTMIGLFKPVILLPTSTLMGLSMQQLEAILAHELAHIRRHDYLVNLLQNLMETLFFYNPAVWWVSHRIRLEREHCCDDMAVAVCGGDKVNYVKALAQLEILRHHPRFALAATGNSLVSRIRRLTPQTTIKTHIPTTWIASSLLLIALLLPTLFWFNPQQGQAQTSESKLQVFDRNGVEITEDIAPHAFMMIRDELTKLNPELLEQSLKVYSTIDLQAQQAANAASLNAEMPPEAQMALVGIDPETGGILAVVGEYLKEDQMVDGLNRAVNMQREVAQTFDPFVYATAFEEGFTQATILADEAMTFKQTGQPDYTPINHDENFLGLMTIRKALDISRDVPVVRAIERVTPEAVAAKGTALGFSNIQPHLPSAMGSFAASPLELSAAMSSFANAGIYNVPHIAERIESTNGETILEFNAEQKRIWTHPTAYMMLDMMRGNVIDNNAFSLRADIVEQYVAGKTGTSGKRGDVPHPESDIWFVGMTPGMVATVWIGYDDGSSIPNKIASDLTRAGDGVVNSSRQPIYIWREFVEGALAGKDVTEEFLVPDGIEFKNIDLTTGEEGSTRMALPAKVPSGPIGPSDSSGVMEHKEIRLTVVGNVTVNLEDNAVLGNFPETTYAILETITESKRQALIADFTGITLTLDGTLDSPELNLTGTIVSPNSTFEGFVGYTLNPVFQYNQGNIPFIEADEVKSSIEMNEFQSGFDMQLSPELNEATEKMWLKLLELADKALPLEAEVGVFEDGTPYSILLIKDPEIFSSQFATLSADAMTHQKILEQAFQHGVIPEEEYKLLLER
jgi:beta-lactamase regulating signal transducer with metallopeptidase domain